MSNKRGTGESWSYLKATAFLKDVFHAAVANADAGRAVAAHLPDKPKGRCIVIGAGKASASMAAAVDAAWPDVDVTGLVVTRYGHRVPAGRIEVMEASHPVPDSMSMQAARRMMDIVSGLAPDDLVIALMSGGGSSLLTLPPKGISLQDKQILGKALLHSGAAISEMNKVRKFFSAIKGGWLAAAARPAKLVTLVISDVPGDDPSLVASGPTIWDNISRREVREIIARYSLSLPEAAQRYLAGSTESPPKPVEQQDVRLIATPALALAKAAEVAASRGIPPLMLGDAIEGESKETGRVMCGIANSVRRHGSPIGRPALLLSGGEASVTIADGVAGRGGRNTEFALAYALAAGYENSTWAIACDTDGIDGTEDAAGAIVTPDTLDRARNLGLDAHEKLASHDSYTFFSALGDLVITGPTFTNVNDFRAILII
jgi:glycerate 2-kinase